MIIYENKMKNNENDEGYIKYLRYRLRN